MGLHTVAELMAISARTAPKSAGQDFVVTKIIEGQDLQRLGEAMIDFGERTGKSNFDRDGENVLDSEAVVLIGLKDARVLGLNCAACGSQTCINCGHVKPCPNCGWQPGLSGGLYCSECLEVIGRRHQQEGVRP